jgi:predicted TPR repeat methyltransferase
MTERTYLGGAHSLREGGAATRGFYDGWAETYDAEIAANGYRAPERCAAALAAAVRDRTRPLIDIGCGTGLSGAAFRAAGFTTIDGTDLSPAMLAKARARGVYRQLTLGDATAGPFARHAYANAAAVGVFGPGHAPPEMIDAVMAALPPGGAFVFTLNDVALRDPAYEAAVESLLVNRQAELVSHARGPHLPGIGIGAIVYVLRSCATA